MKNIAIFVSGGGTDMQSIINAVEAGKIKGRIVAVIASRIGIKAIERTQKHGIPCYVFEKEKYASLSGMYDEVIDLLKKLDTHLIVLAGYLTILTPNIIEAFRDKIINVHPSLIPKYCGKGFYGMKVHEAVIKDKATVSGVTVHYVDEGTDTGRIIAQRKVSVYKNDTPEMLAARVLKEEHKLLPEVVARLCGGVCVNNNIKSYYFRRGIRKYRRKQK